MNQLLPHIQIEGRSGCRLEIIQNTNQVLVRKYASNAAYNSRLMYQQQKQAVFNTAEVNAIGIYSPMVVSSGTEGDLCWFDMHYAGGEKYSNHLIRINKQALDEFVNKLTSYIKHGISISSLEEAPVEIIKQKIKTLNEALLQKVELPIELTNHINAYLTSNLPQSKIYLGKCHGDFTLSNMLFTLDGRIITFDLLDSFIESPIIDLVKLRQDTKYHWSLFVENTHFSNTVKIKQILAYMDKVIVQAFENDEHMAAWEKYLTVFNFARILPYAKDKRDIQYLSTHLTTLLNL